MSIKDVFAKLKSELGDKILALVIAKFLTKENIINILDAALDFLENQADKTEMDADNKALKALREALNIPDND